MRKFKDFGIAPAGKIMTGDKIKIQKVVNREIVVHDYEIKPSNYPEKGNGKCLHLQIALGENRHVIFTGSVPLQEMIERVPKENFPFSTTIVRENERFEFT